MDKERKDKVKLHKDRHGKTYFWCGCHGHIVTLWWDEEFEWDMVEMSFWDSPGSNYGWRHRLRHIWHIIRYGSPFADHIIFDSDEAELFTETLKEFIAKAKANKKQ